jgi:hypothetical protein
MKKDVNDKTMFKFGFVRDEMDNSKFNACGNISYWINSHSIRVITPRNEKLSEEEIVKRIIFNARYQAKEHVLKFAREYDPNQI